ESQEHLPARHAYRVSKPRPKTPEGALYFRTADGSWNNLENPKEGAACTRFLRNVNTEAIRPESGARLMTPNPREISRKLLTRPRHGEVVEMNRLRWDLWKARSCLLHPAPFLKSRLGFRTYFIREPRWRHQSVREYNV